MSAPTPHLAAEVARAVDALKAGGIVAYPTEAMFALAVDIRVPAAVEALRSLQGREDHKPLAVLVADPAHVYRVIRDLPPAAGRLMNAFWPGPLTLVLNAAPGLPEGVTAQSQTVAVRCSSHPVAQALAGQLGGIITATGCNRHGGRPVHLGKDIDPELRAALAYVLDGEPLPLGVPCTVVDARLDEPSVVREGAIPTAAILRALA